MMMPSGIFLRKSMLITEFLPFASSDSIRLPCREFCGQAFVQVYCWTGAGRKAD